MILCSSRPFLLSRSGAVTVSSGGVGIEGVEAEVEVEVENETSTSTSTSTSLDFFFDFCISKQVSDIIVSDFNF